VILLVLEKLHILMSLFVGIVFVALGLYVNVPPLNMAVTLLITMAVFFAIGLFVRAFLRKTLAAGAEDAGAETEAGAEEDGGGSEPGEI
jgi:Kef-type K+ transport system membrane component KefB